jgi:integrase
MSRKSKLQLPFAEWPTEDKVLWGEAFKPGDIFEEKNNGADLAVATRKALEVSYAEFLRFIASRHQSLLNLRPEDRLNRQIISEFVAWFRRSRSDSAIAISLHHLRLALRRISPDTDWSWLLIIAKRIRAQAPRKAKKHHLATSDRLRVLGNNLINDAIAAAEAAGHVEKSHGIDCRDGLIISFAALFLLRRRSVTALRIGTHLIKVGDRWELEVSGADMKNKESMDYPISEELSDQIDVYLNRFRPLIPGAVKHDGLWASNKGCPMSSGAIYDAVFKRTKKAFGYGINLHRFRHGGATFWSMHDPINVRGAKDLLGHSSFDPTEKFYIARLAGRVLARAIDAAID